MSRWTAEVYRSDRSQVGLRRPGDGRPDSDPWADRGCLYIIGPDEARELGRQLIAAADALTPGEDPAPRGAGAPDAAGGALGVGCSLCRHLALADEPKADACPLCGAAVSKGGASGVGLRSTIFECRCCDRVSNGYNDGSMTEPGWHDIDGIDGPNAICPDCVTDPTALDSLRADGYDNARVGGARPVAGSR